MWDDLNKVDSKYKPEFLFFAFLIEESSRLLPEISEEYRGGCTTFYNSSIEKNVIFVIITFTIFEQVFLVCYDV